MISMVQPLHVGNALRLFLEPPAGALAWRVLRKGSDTFAGHDDPSALVAYEGNDRVIVDSTALTNEVRAFYRPFYTSDGLTWVPGATNSGTPAATYVDQTTDVMSEMRRRLEDGLLVECQRGNFATELGYIQVYTSPPTMEQGLRFPLVTIELTNEAPADRAIGECIGSDDFDEIGGVWGEAEGWLANVQLNIVGWSLNGDERIELRKAIRRIVVGNLPVFADLGWLTPSLQAADVNAVNGEYTSPVFQAVCTFTCVAPVCVSGPVDPVREIISRSVE